MFVIEARNVNDALPKMIELLKASGEKRDSRNGPTLTAYCPVTTVYERPTERVLFSPQRDANPFFHLIEALWMLDGRNDIQTLVHYNRRMMEFSEDGVTQQGGYGARWRNTWGFDQIKYIINLLKTHPDTRRAVIQMYDPNIDQDPEQKSKDVPCNLTITPWIRRIGDPLSTKAEIVVLDMTVFCRSNDIIWGAAGANIVHFSILQEYLASMIGVTVGRFYQVSNNFHAYTDIMEKQKLFYLEETEEQNYDRLVRPFPLITDEKTFDSELHWFMEQHYLMLEDFGRNPDTPQGLLTGLDDWKNQFFPRVVIPMVNAFLVFRSMEKGPERYKATRRCLSKHGGWGTIDWLEAADRWLRRRDPITPNVNQ